MANENTKQFTKVIGGVKYTLPRIADLPYNAIELLSLSQNDLKNASDDETTMKTMLMIRELKALLPELDEAGKVLNMKQMNNLIGSWFKNEEAKNGGAPVGKS